MKPASAPSIPGKTDPERFSNALCTVLTVSKEDLIMREAKWKKARERTKRTQKKAIGKT